MSQPLYACVLAVSMLGAQAARAADAPPPPAPAPAAQGTPAAPAVPAPVPPPAFKVDPSRVEEARSLVPPPLLYGGFQPEVGTFVEYELTAKNQPRTHVRAAVVGKSFRQQTGEPIYQVEFDYFELTPRTLVVLWLVGDERPMIDRLAVAVGKHAPISIPVDLYIDLPELRGKPHGEKEVELKAGPFAGKAQQRTYQREKQTTEVVLTPRVPLFGVETVREQATWVARKTGTGATPELNAVPMAVPRMKGM